MDTRILFPTLFIACLALSILSLAYGSTGFEDPLCVASMSSPVAMLRVLRTVTAIVAGTMLALAGSLMQYATRNYLADPFLLGLPSGALLAILLLLLVVPYVPRNTLILAAFLGAMTAYLLTNTIASLAGMSVASLVLAGIAVSTFFSSASHVALYLWASKRLGHAHILLLGSFAYATKSDVETMLIVAAICVTTSFLLWKRLNALVLGDEYSHQLGYDPRATRFLAVTLAAVATSTVVAFVGIVGFLGLLAPNIARMMVGDEARKHLSTSMLCGVALSLAADLFVRAVSQLSTLGELPVSIPMSMVGAPMLAYLVVTSRCRT